MSKFKETSTILLLILISLILIFSISGCGSSTPQGLPVPTETTKQEAASAMASFSKILDDFSTVSDAFQANLGDITSSEVDLDSYKADLVKLHEQASVLLSNAKSIKAASQYQETKRILAQAATLLEMSINDVLKFFDSKKKEQLDLAKEEFKQALRDGYLAETTLNKQVALDGYR